MMIDLLSDFYGLIPVTARPTPRGVGHGWDKDKRAKNKAKRKAIKRQRRR